MLRIAIIINKEKKTVEVVNIDIIARVIFLPLKITQITVFIKWNQT